MRAARSTAPAYLVVGINWKSTSSGHASTAILRAATSERPVLMWEGRHHELGSPDGHMQRGG